uniref:Uncharacterized protein n=1 Tax=Pseudictyota dubia TaxID=2749911 RepID=A0A7R9WMT4_9STRA
MPSSQPSEQPSQYPSTAPSMAPSSEPSSTPSDMPSGSPSFQPSSSPTGQCRLQPDGSFGDITGSPEEVYYDYEVETNTAAVQNDLIPAVEKAINDVLLPVLFSDLCSDGENARRTLLDRKVATTGLRGVRRLEAQMVALSPNPPDMLQTADVCANEDKIGPGNSCSVVRGRLSIYGVFTTEGDLSRTRAAVTDAIRLGMEGDALVASHPSIVRLFFVQRNTTIPQMENPNQVQSVDVRADGGGAFPWVIAASIVSLVIVGSVLGWRKLRKNQEVDEDEDEGSDGEHDIAPQQMMDVEHDASIDVSESEGTFL